MCIRDRRARRPLSCPRAPRGHRCWPRAQMDPSDFEHMPPFPFPAELFPTGTFPKGMKTTREILTGLPPSVLELIETGKSGTAASAPLPAGSSAAGDGTLTLADSVALLFCLHPRRARCNVRKGVLAARHG